MASLLPLLQDLLPMIIPSSVHVSRDRELAVVAERAEVPPWYDHTPQANMPLDSSGPRQTGADVDDAASLAVRQPGQQAEPIELLDREGPSGGRFTDEAVFEDVVHGANAGPRSLGHEPIADAAATGPKVFRKDAMVGVTDKMCSTGKPSHSPACRANPCPNCSRFTVVSVRTTPVNVCGYPNVPALSSHNLYPPFLKLIFCILGDVLWTL